MTLESVLEIRRTVSPVLRRAGLRSVSQGEDFVRWEGARTWFEVRCNWRDGDLGAYFGACDVDEDLSFGLFLKAVDTVLADEADVWLLEAPADLSRLLALLVRALEAHGADILRGEPAAYDFARKLRWWDFGPGTRS